MSEKSRRTLGAAFGAGMGLLYALVAQSINPLFLPGVPLYPSPSGRLTAILLSALLGGVLGLVAAWPDDAVPGVILSAITGIVLTTLYSVYGPGQANAPLAPTFIVFVFTFLPRALLFVPLAILVRWLLSRWSDELQSTNYSVRKMLLSLAAALAVAGLAGLLSLYPQGGRIALRGMDSIIQAGLAAGRTGSLPHELQSVDGFLQEAQGAYTLQLSDNADFLNVPVPTTSYSENQYTVLAVFDSGFRFGCVFFSSGSQAACSAY
jgi:hypothetical protein